MESLEKNDLQLGDYVSQKSGQPPSKGDGSDIKTHRKKEKSKNRKINAQPGGSVNLAGKQDNIYEESGLCGSQRSNVEPGINSDESYVSVAKTLVTDGSKGHERKRYPQKSRSRKSDSRSIGSTSQKSSSSSRSLGEECQLNSNNLDSKIRIRKGSRIKEVKQPNSPKQNVEGVKIESSKQNAGEAEGDQFQRQDKDLETLQEKRFDVLQNKGSVSNNSLLDEEDNIIENSSHSDTLDTRRNVDILCSLGDDNIRLGDATDDPDEKIKYYKEAVKSLEKAVKSLEKAVKSLEKAVKSLEKAKELKPRDLGILHCLGVANNNLGYANNKLGDATNDPDEKIKYYKEAVKSLEKAKELKPRDPDILHNLGDTNNKLGDATNDPDEKIKYYKEAVKSLEEAKELKPRDRDISHNLDVANKNLNDAIKKAAREKDRSSKANEGNPLNSNNFGSVEEVEDDESSGQNSPGKGHNSDVNNLEPCSDDQNGKAITDSPSERGCHPSLESSF